MKVTELFESKGQSAADALEAGLSRGFGQKVTLSDAMRKALDGLKAKGKLKDLGECVFDPDTLGRAKPKASYFDADPKDSQHKLQLAEMPGLKKLISGKTKEGNYVLIFKHKTLPLVYTVSTDGESGTWVADRLELGASVTEAILPAPKKSKLKDILDRMSDSAAKNLNIHASVEDFRALFVGGDSKGMRKLQQALIDAGYDELGGSYEDNKLIFQKLGLSKFDLDHLVDQSL